MPLDPWDDIFLQTFRPRVQTQAVKPQEEQALPPLSAEEEDSLLSSVGGKVLGGLGYVGGLLDKYTGGRAVRGVLGGKPQELLSLLPGSDALGITQESDRVSGQDLLENAGIVDKGSDSLPAMLGGIATEIALSPATYLTFGGGALTEAGQVASKFGGVPSSMLGRIQGVSSFTPGQLAKAAQLGIDTASLVNKPLGGVLGVGLPFAKPAAIIGASPGGAKFAQGLAAAGSAVRQAPVIRPVMDAVGKVTEPLARYGRALFDPNMAGAISKEAQAVAPGMMEGVETGLARLRGHEVDVLRAQQAAGMLDEAGDQAVRRAGELLPKNPLQAVSPTEQAAYNLSQQVNAPLNQLNSELSNIGLGSGQLQDDYAAYMARHQRQLERSTLGYGGEQQTFPIAQSALSGREDILRNVPGATVEGINPMTLDKELSGLRGTTPPAQVVPAPQRAALLRERYLGFNQADEAELQVARQLQQQHQSQVIAARFAQQAPPASPLSPAQQLLLDRAQHSEALVDWLSKLDPQYAQKGIPYFSNPVVADMMQTGAAQVRRLEAGKAVHQMLTDAAVPVGAAEPGSVRLDANLLQRMGFTDANAANNHLQGLLGGTGKAGDLWVPNNVVNDATRFLQGHTTPAALQPFIRAIDTVTNLTKAYQTALWPAFHVRNFVSGMWQNFVLGASDARYAAADPRAWIAPVMDAQNMLRGGVVKDLTQLPLFQSIGATTDEAATAALSKMAYQYRATSHGVHQGFEVVGDTLPTAAEQTQKIPGMVPFEGFGATLKKGVTGLGKEQGWNPLGVSGVGNFNKDVFAPMQAGREIGTAVEDTNRLSAFIGLIRQGFDPATAAQKVRAAHVDYAALAPFERSVMRRLVPFYSYSRRVIPFTIEQMIQRPGGLSGSLAQATYSLRQQDDTFVPEWMGGGLAIPIGEEVGGTQRFLSKLDTPAETAFEFVRPSASETGMSVLGQTNPLIKAPLELATDKQLFTGRDLGDLYPITGSTLADQAIMNSPLSRFVTTGRQIGQVASGRKDVGAAAVNLGTGVRLTDVDQEKARDIAARELIKERLQGQEGIGRFETIYPRPGMLSQLTPEEIALLRLGKRLDVKAKERGNASKGKGK